MYIQLQCTKKDKEIQISIKELYKKINFRGNKREA